MRKKLWPALICVMLLLGLCSVSAMAITADSGTCGSNLTWTLNSSGVLTISGTGTMTSHPWNNDDVRSVVIKNGVTSITQDAFKGTRLQSVTIPGSVGTIGYGAFSNCISLRSVTIDDGVVKLADADSWHLGVFEGCTALTTVNIKGNTLTHIGYEAFKGCVSLKNIIFPSSVQTINDYAFKGCETLASATMPGVTEIKVDAFADCSRLNSVSMPSIKSIGPDAFSNCTSLKSLNLPTTLATIKDNAFKGSGLQSVTIPGSVGTIGYGAFSNCISLRSVTIDDGVVKLADADSWRLGVFEGCTALTTVNIKGNTLTHIGYEAFKGCVSLKQIAIPYSVVYIHGSAFYNCAKLSQIYFKGNAPISIGSSCFYNVTATAYYPAGDSTWTSDIMQDYGGDITWRTHDGSTLTLTASPTTNYTWRPFQFSLTSSASKVTLHILDDATQQLQSVTMSKSGSRHTYTHMFTHPGTKTVWAEPSSGFSSDPVTVEVTAPYGKLDTPVAANSTVNCATGQKTTVSWNHVDFSDTYTAYVYQNDTMLANISNSVNETSVSYTFTAAGTYQIHVYAVGWGNTPSDACVFTVNVSKGLATPTVKVSNASTGVKITWNKVTDAGGYLVYRSNDGKTWTKLKQTTGLTYTDTTATSGKTYYYSVKAFVKNDGTIIYSNYDKTKKIIRLKQPAITLSNTSAGVKISWGKVTGAAGYEVYRSTNGKSWTKLKTTTSTSYTDTKAAAGKTYYYTVKAYKSLSGTKIISSCDKTKKIIRLKQPAITLSNTSTGTKISWGKVTGADGYLVYRSTDGKKWTKLKQTTTSLSYTDKSAAKGKNYYYTVKAYNTVNGKKYVSSYKASSSVKGNAAMVWIPQTGSKYHSRSSCSKMKDPQYITLYEAQNMGYDACKRCH